MRNKGIKMVFSRAMMERYEAASKMLYEHYSVDPFEIRTACEVGVGPLSFMVPYVGLAEKMILIEPHRDLVEHTKTYMPPEFVHQAAVAHKECRLNFRDNGANGTGFLSMLDWSPYKHDPRKMQQRYRVDAFPFDHWDDGKIDIMNIDCEGSEHFVISNMVSRPFIICIEIDTRNPKAEYIRNWLSSEGYHEEGSGCGGAQVYRHEKKQKLA